MCTLGTPRVRLNSQPLTTGAHFGASPAVIASGQEEVSPDAINFMLRWARGLVCMPCAPERLDALGIHPMLAPGTATCDTAFSVTIDHVQAGSGIGAADRARTIREVLNRESVASDFIRPGHVFPLRARAGGVAERRGHTEAAVDLARLAGLAPVAVICEVLHDDGSPARLPYLQLFAQEHRIAMISVEQVAQYRAQTESSTSSPLLLL